ncbi:hypothetical protein H920_14676 [Fukomys damarensis]|uniref:Uncharacterized protein n=1 Tax=Fukomys damarensis TaxID=885580 RepID=A0A091CW68_FUKDA|nr:hypothetical protein H920_14676 [Fukomys damarensis]
MEQTLRNTSHSATSSGPGKGSSKANSAQMFPVVDQKASEYVGGKKCEIIHKSMFIALGLEVNKFLTQRHGTRLEATPATTNFEVLGYAVCVYLVTHSPVTVTPHP